MTAAECIEDEDPHDRNDRAVLVTAQNVEPEANQEATHADFVSSTVQKNSANSFSYPLYLSFVLAIVGLSGYFI